MLFLTIIREIKNSLGRYLAILAIVALGTGFYCGLKISTAAMVNTGDSYLKKANLYDFRFVSPLGFDRHAIDKIRENKFVKEYEAAYSFDVLFDDGKNNSLVLHTMSVPDKINKVVLKRGRMPREKDECIIDEIFPNANKLIGKDIEISNDNKPELLGILKAKKFKVVGVCNSPLYMNYERGNTSVGNGTVAGFIYLDKSAFESALFTDVYITCGEYEKIYSSAYEKKITKYEEKFKNLSPHVLDRESNIGYVSFKNDTSIVDSVSLIFPVFFFAIAALVCMTSMTRMIDEHRMQLGVYKALGFGKLSILSMYLIYSGSASLIGAVLGYFSGIYIFPTVIWRAYKIMYAFAGKIEFTADIGLGSFALITALACTNFATIVTCVKDTHEVPAALIRPRAPKAGKRIFLERITFIWDRLPFLYKISMRNVFRYKGRLMMMIIGISGCTALLVAGFGMRSSISHIATYQYGEIQLYDYSVVFNRALTADEQKSFVRQAKHDGGKASKVKFCNQLPMKYVGKHAGKSGSNSLKLITMTNDDFSSFIDLHYGTRKVDFPEDGKLVLCKKYADIYKLEKGDKIKLSDNDLNEYEFEISDIFDNYIYNYAYMSPATHREIFGKSPEINTAFVDTKLNGDSREEELNSAAAKVRGFDNVTSVSLTDEFKYRVNQMMKSLNAVIILVVISAAALAFIVLYNLTNINITERIREIATIKVLGFYSRETSAYVSRENIFLTLLSAVIGLPLGRFLLKFILSEIKVDLVAFPLRITYLDYLYAFALTLIFAVIVMMFMRIKIRRINMSESLKSVE